MWHGVSGSQITSVVENKRQCGIWTGTPYQTGERRKSPKTFGAGWPERI